VSWATSAVDAAAVLKPSTSVIGTGDVIRLPADSQQVDAEAELAVVIGHPGQDVTREGARITCWVTRPPTNVTARDQQPSDVQFTERRGYDSFCPLGPWIGRCSTRSTCGSPPPSTASYAGRAHSQMVHDVPSLIAFAVEHHDAAAAM